MAGAIIFLSTTVSLLNTKQWRSPVAVMKNNIAYADTSTLRDTSTEVKCSFASEIARKGVKKVYASNLADVTAPMALTDTPVFWHVPKSGGTTMKDIGRCSGLVEASHSGIEFEVDRYLKTVPQNQLAAFEPWEGFWLLNVDTDSPVGLERAKSMGLVPSGLADVIYTSRLFENAAIFNPDHKGRMFTLLRHPVERAISIFYYLQDANWEPTFSPETRNWTLAEYVNSSYCENNWLVRMIVQNFETDLCQSDLDLAKSILSKKFLIGLLAQIEESVKRFDNYFGFDRKSGRFASCTHEFIRGRHGSNRHVHPKVEPDSDDWKALALMNHWDIQLYEWAIALFEEQAFHIDFVKVNT